MRENGKALIVAGRFGLRVHRRHLAQHDEEIPGRAARCIARHRQRAIIMGEARLARRLMLDRRQDALGVILCPALDEAIVRAADGPIEDGAVEPLLVDIAQEITGGDRCLIGMQRHHNASGTRIERHPHIA